MKFAGGQALAGAAASSSGNAQTQRFQHIGAARAAGDRAVAVLDDRHPAGRREQRRAGGDVETAGAVAAGADDIDGRAARQESRAGAPGAAWPARSRAVRRRRRPWRAAPPARAPAKRGRSVRIGQDAEQLLGLAAALRSRRSSSRSSELTRALARQRCARTSAQLRKFPSSRGPSGVRMLSGWNCTPSTVSVAVAHAHDLALRRARADTQAPAACVSGAAISE